MKNKFIETTILKIKKKKDISPLQEKKYRYGLEAFYNLITKLILLFIITSILHIVKEFILLMAMYSLFRLYGFGIHMKSSIACLCLTLPIYIGGCYFIRYANIPIQLSIVIWIMQFIIFILYAPADTPARPLIHEEKRKQAKIKEIILLIICCFIYYYFHILILNNSIIYALVMEGISIHPFTYYLCHTTYCNYKNV